MAKIFWFLGALVLIYVLYSGVRFYRLVKISGGIITHTVPFSKGDNDHPGSETILVLGDSSAVGVGANSPVESVAGRLSDYMHADYVENRAVSGAQVSDLPGQIAKASLPQYSIILIQIGGNDIVRFHNATQTANLLANELVALPPAGKVVVISAGDVGSAPLFPLPFHPIYHALNISYHAEFTRALAAPIVTASGPTDNITYVNLYTAPGNSLFSSDPKTYFAADGFHPSSDGYGVWFNAVRSAL